MAGRASRAGRYVKTSSRRAPNVPKCRYRLSLRPQRASSVLVARSAMTRAAAPGKPAVRAPATAQKSVQSTPSVRFSATLSTQARHTPRISRREVSRPTIMDTAFRASSIFPASAASLTRRAWRASETGARQSHTDTAAMAKPPAVPAEYPARAVRHHARTAGGRITARPARKPAIPSRRGLPPTVSGGKGQERRRLKKGSAREARYPMPQTGWTRAGGSLKRRSRMRAAGRRKRAWSALICVPSGRESCRWRPCRYVRARWQRGGLWRAPCHMRRGRPAGGRGRARISRG